MPPRLERLDRERLDRERLDRRALQVEGLDRERLDRERLQGADDWKNEPSGVDESPASSSDSPASARLAGVAAGNVPSAVASAQKFGVHRAPLGGRIAGRSPRAGSHSAAATTTGTPASASWRGGVPSSWRSPKSMFPISVRFASGSAGIGEHVLHVGQRDGLEWHTLEWRPLQDAFPSAVGEQHEIGQQHRVERERLDREGLDRERLDRRRRGEERLDREGLDRERLDRERLDRAPP